MENIADCLKKEKEEELPSMEFVNVKPDFEALLYEDEVEDEDIEESSESESGDENDEPVNRSRSSSPVAPPYSPLSPPERCGSRERSRSPIARHQPSDSISPWGIVIYDEKGLPLDPPDAPLTDDVGEGVFIAPGEHVTFELDETIKSVVSERGTSRQRGVRSVRGRSRGDRGRKSRLPKWEVGCPIDEIWTTDDDLPPACFAKVYYVSKRKQENMPDREEEREIEDDEEDAVLDTSDDRNSLEEGLNMRFDWFPMDSFRCEEEIFKLKSTGSTRCYKSAYDAFRSYWGDEILERIAAETNHYATKIESASFQSQWFPTNVHEILCLFAFWMMLGVHRMPTIHSCFSNNPLLNTEVFKRIFTKNRYESLCRALHFVDSDPACNDTNPSKTSAARSLDRLHRLRPIISHLNSKFQSNYILDKDICIDESLTLWKGRLDIKQYIRTKASKLGIKTFELCESRTGYLWSFIVYTGKKSSLDIEHTPFVRKSTTLVKKLISPLLNKGHRLFMDNWYNSPLLARFLKMNGTDCVGTLRSFCHDVPAPIYRAPLERGQMIARHSGDIMVLSWQDQKRVTMISTCHGSSTALPTVASRPFSRPVPHKPQVVLDYNKFMGGVDLKDQMLEPYLIERKRCAKWYMKLFKRLLNVSILNSRILLQSSSQKHHDHLAFRLQLVDTILRNHLSHCPLSRRFTATKKSTDPLPCRMPKNTHWPVRLERPETSSENTRNYRKHCVYCLREGRKTLRTAYKCEFCDVPLCIEYCFKAYHT